MRRRRTQCRGGAVVKAVPGVSLRAFIALTGRSESASEGIAAPNATNSEAISNDPIANETRRKDMGDS